MAKIRCEQTDRWTDRQVFLGPYFVSGKGVGL